MLKALVMLLSAGGGILMSMDQGSRDKFLAMLSGKRRKDSTPPPMGVGSSGLDPATPSGRAAMEATDPGFKAMMSGPDAKLKSRVQDMAVSSYGGPMINPAQLDKAVAALKAGTKSTLGSHLLTGLNLPMSMLAPMTGQARGRSTTLDNISQGAVLGQAVPKLPLVGRIPGMSGLGRISPALGGTAMLTRLISASSASAGKGRDTQAESMVGDAYDPDSALTPDERSRAIWRARLQYTGGAMGDMLALARPGTLGWMGSGSTVPDVGRALRDAGTELLAGSPATAQGPKWKAQQAQADRVLGGSPMTAGDQVTLALGLAGDWLLPGESKLGPGSFKSDSSPDGGTAYRREMERRYTAAGLGPDEARRAGLNAWRNRK